MSATKNLIAKLTMLLALAVTLVAPEAKAENPMLKQGMQEYNAGNYSDAAGHLGGALSTDFNNAVLHYFLGSCYVHMKQKESAIREFRIAYALEPEKEVGKFSKQALASYGVESPDAKDKALDAAKPPIPGGPPAPGGPLIPGGPVFPPQTTESLKNAAKVDPPKIGKSPSYPNTVQINFMPKSEIQRTAANLLDLMQQEAKPGSMRLSPSGTNLYIRNYEMTPAAPTTTPQKKSWDQFTP